MKLTIEHRNRLEAAVDTAVELIGEETLAELDSEELCVDYLLDEACPLAGLDPKDVLLLVEHPAQYPDAYNDALTGYYVGFVKGYAEYDRVSVTEAWGRILTFARGN